MQLEQFTTDAYPAQQRPQTWREALNLHILRPEMAPAAEPLYGNFNITDKRIRRDSFTSVPELEMAIDLQVAQHNIEPKPFIWIASASDILAKITRAKADLAATST